VRGTPAFRPFAVRGRRTLATILVTFAAFSAVSLTLSIRATSRARLQGAVLEVAGRQRTLSERYVSDVQLVLSGVAANPNGTAALLRKSATVLLDGGEAPAVDGDDDEATVPRASAPSVRAQLRQQRRLIDDLVATGDAILAGKDATALPQTAGEHVTASNSLERLRILAAMTSNTSLNGARTIAETADRGVNGLITLQVVLGVAGFLAFLVLAVGLIAATRRQTAHFRSLVKSSTDLVLVISDGQCRYVSDSVVGVLNVPETDLLGRGILDHVHPDDRVLVDAAAAHGEPHEIVFRLRNSFGEWRHLEAHVSDLRNDRDVRGIVLNARDVTERVRLDEELTRQAFHDALTGLANRALFRDRLDQAVARAARSGESVAVVLADLDGFKAVNDSLGHDAGDQLLQRVAERFAETTRAGDTLARLGGDEFAMLLEDTDEYTAVQVAKRLLDQVAAPVAVSGREFAVGASVGIAVQSGPGVTEQLLRHADVAMYAAKEAGRGRLEVFREDMARDLGEQLGLEYEMRQGLAQGEFSVHYQPELAVETRRVVGVEALLRWSSPSRGEMAPTRFIPVAEASGLILQLGEFVLFDACTRAADWRARGLIGDDFTMWVNLSGRQLSAGGVDELVMRALSKTGLPASMLGLEVTETAIVAEGYASERAREELELLHTRGVRIAIDDFGTGVSSLSQLRRFPVDLIKVDQSFVRGLDAKDAAIATNVVNLAHALGLPAIAEGIETDAQLASMREVGCDLAQGYLFARPAPAEEIGALLEAGQARQPAAGAPTRSLT
jgi:diguanylate cyclase (GGDEF)-like protein/PAS domain S-box-containing protein